MTNNFIPSLYWNNFKWNRRQNREQLNQLWSKLQYIGSKIKWHDKYLQKGQLRNSGWESITIFCQVVNIRSNIVTRHIRPFSFIDALPVMSCSRPRGMSVIDVKIEIIIIRFFLQHTTFGYVYTIRDFDWTAFETKPKVKSLATCIWNLGSWNHGILESWNLGIFESYIQDCLFCF